MIQDKDVHNITKAYLDISDNITQFFSFAINIPTG